MVDGWMLGPDSKLLFWVPPTFRTGLWRPRNTAVIGASVETLDFGHFVHGEDWVRCKDPLPDIPGDFASNLPGPTQPHIQEISDSESDSDPDLYFDPPGLTPLFHLFPLATRKTHSRNHRRPTGWLARLGNIGMRE